MAYLTLDGFTLRSMMPPEDITALELQAPGWILAQLESVSRLDVDARLRKRYAAPFSAPYPEAITTWLARIVTERCYVRRGVDPQDKMFGAIRDDAATARAEIKEAADSSAGLFDLPLRDSEKTTGIVGGPRSYSEASPYVFSDIQSSRGRNEDQNGNGT